VQLKGDTIAVRATGRNDQNDLVHDFEALLETELLKDDPRLREDDSSPSILVTCRITDYAHPQPTVTKRPSLAFTKNAQKEQAYTRVTGSLRVSFQAKNASGKMLDSDNVTVKYDREFDSSGNTSSEGVKGSMTSAWKRLAGGSGSSSEDLNPPTDAELRSQLMLQAVRQIAEHLVNTNETVEVFLARQKGALEEGDKQADAGLWERALETFETASPSPKPDEDAYRLYNTGVAYEALAYKAEDPKSAMKYLDEAAIDYGKAIDAKPAEHYFLEPQRRIEDAIAHYKQLEDQTRQQSQAAETRGLKPPIADAADFPGPAVSTTGGGAPPASGTNATPSATKGLTNAQVVAMVKADMDDDTVMQAVRSAKVVNFDVTTAGQQALIGDGVSLTVIQAMKTRAERTHLAATHPAATHAVGGSTTPK
jgi:tetratricopeptide (TPR) repeat protein